MIEGEGVKPLRIHCGERMRVTQEVSFDDEGIGVYYQCYECGYVTPDVVDSLKSVRLHVKK